MHAVRQRHSRSWIRAPRMLVPKYVEQHDPAIMLGSKRSVGVIPQDKVRISGIHCTQTLKNASKGFFHTCETRAGVNRSPKTG